MDQDLFQTAFWQQYGRDLAWFLGLAALALLGKKPVTQVLIRGLAWVGGHFIPEFRSKDYAGMVYRPLAALVQVFLLYMAFNHLGIILGKHIVKRYPDRPHFMDLKFGQLLDHLFMLLAIFFITLFLVRTAGFLFSHFQAKLVARKDPGRGQLFPFLKDLVEIVLWVIGLFWVLGTVFHMNIPALITGIGLGGLAIALAAKETVENLFATFIILWDKPFQVRDRIKIGGFEGRVTQIGLRSTRLEGDQGIQYVVPNKKLVTEAMENLSFRRRVKIRHEVHVKYDMPGAELRERLKSIQEVIRNTLYVVGPVEILVEQLGEASMKLVIHYHLSHPIPEGADPVRIKQEIGLKVYEIMGEKAA